MSIGDQLGVDRLMEVCVTGMAKLVAMTGYKEKAKDINVMGQKNTPIIQMYRAPSAKLSDIIKTRE